MDPEAILTFQASLKKVREDLAKGLAQYLFKKLPLEELTAEQKGVLRECVAGIYPPVTMFALRTRGGRSPGKAKRALERLERTSKTGGKAWENAWSTMPLDSYYQLLSATPGRPIGLFGTAPDPAELGAAMPAAMNIAKRRSRKMQLRDDAVLAILVAFEKATGITPTFKQTAHFIQTVEAVYVNAHLLDGQGFRVLKSASVFSRLVQRAKAILAQKTCTHSETIGATQK